ncbi:MAG TPA: ChbG/HpnK family deacetylase [Candidatus Eisenbacteria bacterium]|nr:ChbG/HpnK family deacetylase [Candidatus Eisenbacteria bacterium]
MSSARYLIVNADDFGQSPGVNRGIMEAHERGIVTSASLMTRWLAAGEAALYAKEHPKLSLGLHLDFGEWVYQAGTWVPLYTVVSLEDKSAVEREVYRQLETFRYLVGRDPSHINSHQNVHMREPVRSVALQVCERLGVPLRNLCPEIHYATKFYGQTEEGRPLPAQIRLDRLIAILAALPAGLTVLVCHPGDVNDLHTVYRSERAEEVKVLCDPRLKQSIEALGIRLCSFEDCTFLKNGMAARPKAKDHSG